MSSEKICPRCNHVNSHSRYFCEKCGIFLEAKNFSTKVFDGYEKKFMKILENLKYVPHEKTIWDNVINAYVQQMETCKSLFGLPELGAKNNSDLCNKIDDFLDLCYNPQFQIAFVGTIKTGKSTLINALLGRNYASMAVTPETAALTKFRRSNVNYVDVTFYNRDEWNELWASRTSTADAFTREYKALNAEAHKDKWVGHAPIHVGISNDQIEQELKQWSSSQSPEHYFVKEIEVGISNLPDSLPEKIVFVDTPGLSDPVAYRSEITKEYIRKANAVFVCVDAQKLQKPEIETISSVFSFSSHNKNKVHIVATHLDKLNNPKEDWADQYVYLQNQLTGKAFFEDPEMAKRNIMPSAAYIFNICRDNEKFSPKEAMELMKFGMSLGILPYSEDYDEMFFEGLKNISRHKEALMELTNISNIRKVITEEFAGNYKKLLHDDIMAKYKDVVFSIKRFATEEKTTAEDLIKTANADINEVKAKVEQQRKNYDAISQSREQLAAVLKTVEKKTNDRLERILAKLDANARR